MRTIGFTTVLAVLALATGGFAPVPGQGRPRPPAPYAALTSPTAAMRVVFAEVCLTAIKDGESIETLALAHRLVPVPPRSTGSPTATAAWRLASYSKVYVVSLPNGGCSASVEGGDPEGLRAAALDMLVEQGGFAEGQTLAADDNSRTVWCTAEEVRPLIVVLVKRTRGRRPAFVANIFHAENRRPSFCRGGAAATT